MKKIKNATSGITLIALVITIIVLLILAGVSLATLTGENGVLTRAQNSVERNRAGELQEEVDLTVTENEIIEYEEDSDDKITKQQVVSKMYAEGKLTEEETNKLLGKNGETEVDIIMIGGVAVDFSKLAGALPPSYAIILDNNKKANNQVPMIFVREENEPIVGEIYSSETYGDLPIVAVYTGFETDASNGREKWFNDDNYELVTSVVFEDRISPLNTSYWFYGMNLCKNINLSKLDTSNVNNMNTMFHSCSSLTSLDLSNFDTSNVTDMSYMFSFCTNLTSIDLSSFNTSNVIDMMLMFRSCRSLTSLDLSNFDTSKVTCIESMFAYCEKLASLDLSNFDTSKVDSMWEIFSNCTSLNTLDLSNFNTSKVEYMQEMFYNCKNLKTIYVSKIWSRESLDESFFEWMDENTFLGCTNLVGAISYDSSKTTSEYANYTDGYFTYKAASNL